MQFLAVIVLSIFAAVLYGVLHDQVTARICVEYFTIGHPPIFLSDDPTVLAFGWGIIATWWVGLLLGLPLAVVARAGRRPKRSAVSLIRPITFLMIVNGVIAFCAGIIGWLLARNGIVILLEPLASQVPAEKHETFLADLWAHLSSYLVGFVGGTFVLFMVWRSRSNTARQTVK